jgi:hypothetical protein
MVLKAKVWSNASFIVPLILSLIFQIYLLAILLAIIIVFSSLYHHAKEEKYEKIDILFASLLFIADIYMCYLSGFKEPYFALAAVLLVAAVFFHLKS